MACVQESGLVLAGESLRMILQWVFNLLSCCMHAFVVVFLMVQKVSKVTLPIQKLLEVALLILGVVSFIPGNISASHLSVGIWSKLYLSDPLESVNSKDLNLV